MDEWIGIGEACQILGISRNTVKRLVREGILPAFEITGVQGYQFRRAEVEILRKRVVPKPKPRSKGRKRK